MTFCWHCLPFLVKLIDIGIALLAVIYIIAAFRAWARARPINRKPEELDRAAAAVGNSIMIFTTADSILVTGVGILTQARASALSPSAVVTQLLLSGIGFVVAILFGMLATTYLLNHLHHENSVAEHHLVMGYAVGQFTLTLAASAFFLISIFLI